MKTCAFILLFAVLSLSLFSQKKVEFNGYINNMQSFMFSDIDNDNWISDNLLHNRINGVWYISNSISLRAEVRNRFFVGESLELNPLSKDSYDFDPGWIDMSFNISDGNSYLLNSTIDRLFLEVNYEKINITLGRQRINWGRTFVWNPNDIFNTYSFFDVDYPERPGSDALRIQYYTGFASSIEAVVKIDHNDKITAAGIVRFNIGSYDFQIIHGILEERDLLAGAGWEGNIKNIGFRSEFTYFHPHENWKDTTGVLLASMSFDYTFSNSMIIQVEGLYNYSETGLELTDFTSLLTNSLNVKNMAFSEWNVFGQISYPVSPIINISVSGMYFTDLKGFFTGPSFSLSLSDNADFSFFAQYFNWEISGVRSDMTLAYLRLKYSF